MWSNRWTLKVSAIGSSPSPPKTQQSNQLVKVSDVEHTVDTQNFSHWQQPLLPPKTQYSKQHVKVSDVEHPMDTQSYDIPPLSRDDQS
jgi:hypothetical protein